MKLSRPAADAEERGATARAACVPVREAGPRPPGPVCATRSQGRWPGAALMQASPARHASRARATLAPLRPPWVLRPGAAQRPGTRPPEAAAEGAGAPLSARPAEAFSTGGEPRGVECSQGKNLHGCSQTLTSFPQSSSSRRVQRSAALRLPARSYPTTSIHINRCRSSSRRKDAPRS